MRAGSRFDLVTTLLIAELHQAMQAGHGVDERAHDAVAEDELEQRPHADLLENVVFDGLISGDREAGEVFGERGDLVGGLGRAEQGVNPAGAADLGDEGAAPGGGGGDEHDPFVEQAHASCSAGERPGSSGSAASTSTGVAACSPGAGRVSRWTKAR